MYLYRNVSLRMMLVHSSECRYHLQVINDIISVNQHMNWLLWCLIIFVLLSLLVCIVGITNNAMNLLKQSNSSVNNIQVSSVDETVCWIKNRNKMKWNLNKVLSLKNLLTSRVVRMTVGDKDHGKIIMHNNVMHGQIGHERSFDEKWRKNLSF